MHPVVGKWLFRRYTQAFSVLRLHDGVKGSSVLALVSAEIMSLVLKLGVIDHPEARVRHARTCPYRPRTNDKAERLIQTAQREWVYGVVCQSSD